MKVMTAEQAVSDAVNKYIIEARDRDIHYIPMLPQLTKILTDALRAHANAVLEEAAATVWTTPVLPPLEPLDDFHFVSKTIRLQLAAAIRALREEA